MTGYYLMLAVPFFFKFLSLISEWGTTFEDKKKGEQRIIITFFITLIVLLALRREDIGTDLINYKNNFNNIASYQWSDLSKHNFEWGYVFLNKLVSSLGGDFQVFLGVLAAISLTPIAYLYYKESNNPFIVIGLFISISVIDMYFSGLRQMLATAFVVPAYYFTKNKKIFKFLLCVLLAYYCHKSAVVFLLFYPMYHIKLTKNSILVIAPIMAVVFAYRDKIFTFLLKYLDEEYQDRYSTQKDTGAYTVLLLFVLLMVYTLFLIDEEKSDSDTKGLQNILVLATCIQFFASVNTVAMRMNFYFIPFIPILLSKIEHCAKEGDKPIVNLANFVMSVFFVGYFLYKGHSDIDPLNIFPYYTFWE